MHSAVSNGVRPATELIKVQSGGIAEAILKDAPFTAQGNALQTLTIDGGTTGASAAWQGDDTLQG